VAVLGAAIVVWVLGPAGWQGAGIGLAVGAGLFLIGAALFAVGAIGGGDVKLVAAVGAWVGLHGLPSFLVVMALLGGALALLQLAGGRLGGAGGWLAPERGVPYGVAIALAGLLVGPGITGD
jgi:prepilin peptidase CpaA